MNIFLLILSLLAPLILQAAEAPVAEDQIIAENASEETPQEGQPDSRKRKRGENNICARQMRRCLGSPGSEEFLKQKGALRCTERPCDHMSIGLINPELEVMPILLKNVTGVVKVFFISRAAVRRGQNPGTLLNVNTANLMRMANFPWISMGSTFPNPLGGDPEVLFRTIATRSLSSDILEALERQIDVLDFSNTSMGLVNNDMVESFAPNTRQILLSENVSTFKRHINEITSFVDVVYGDEQAPAVEITVDERDQRALSLFPTEENFMAHFAQLQASLNSQQ